MEQTFIKYEKNKPNRPSINQTIFNYYLKLQQGTTKSSLAGQPAREQGHAGRVPCGPTFLRRRPGAWVAFAQNEYRRRQLTSLENFTARDIAGKEPSDAGESKVQRLLETLPIAFQTFYCTTHANSHMHLTCAFYCWSQSYLSKLPHPPIPWLSHYNLPMEHAATVF